MASILKVDKLDPQSGTALEIGTSGDTITVPSGATLDISASTLTPPATMPASSGVNLTALNATQLTSGTVPTARLGSGTASSSTVLYGDQTYKTEPGGGKLLAHVFSTYGTQQSSTSSTYADMNLATAAITPASSSSKFFVILNTVGEVGGSGVRLGLRLIARWSDSDNVILTHGIDILNSAGSWTGGRTLSVTHAPATTADILWKAEFNNQLASGTSVQVHANNYTSILSVFELGV